MIERIAKRLTRKPKLVAVIAAVMLIPALFGYIGTGINYDILSYLPKDLDSSKGIDILEEPFHMAATSMLIVDNMPAGYSNQLIRDIRNIDGVSNAVWISNILGLQIPTDMIPQQFRDMFFSGEGTMMIVQYEKGAASAETMEAIDEIRALGNDNCYLSGFSVIVKDTRDLMDKELPLFVGLAVLLSLVAMGLTLAETALPFVLIANIGIAILYNFGSNIFLGEISYITKAIAAVLQLGVTMDYSIFLYRRYEEEKDFHEDKRDAMKMAVVAAFRSLFGSSLTTVAGFLALCFMNLTLGRDIGIVMAKGVVLGVITVIFVMPSIVLLADEQLSKYRHRFFMPDLKKANEFFIRHRRVVVIATLLVLAPALYAENNATVYYKLDEALPKTTPAIVANTRLADEFNMATSHYALVSDDLKATDMNEMEKAIKEVPGVTDVISYHSMLGSGIPDFFIPEEVKTMLKQGGRQIIMINSEYATASTEVGEQIDTISAILKSYDKEALLTGEAALTADLIKTTAVDFKVTNYISIAAIFLIIAVIFKSISIPAVLVAIIELAIIINQGVPYFTGTEVAFVAPTIISCVQLGATVDYAILMTSRFQEELREGRDRFEAIDIASTASDASIITSALVMFCATLGVSFVSSIELIGDICIMLARGAMISAFICIVVLPPVLCVCEPIFAKTTMHWTTFPEKVERARTSRIEEHFEARLEAQLAARAKEKKGESEDHGDE